MVPMARRNKHRKPKDNSHKKLIAATVATGAAVPLVSVTAADAAPVSAWDKVAQCESGGRWNIPFGDADSTGGLQIQQRTWNDYGGQAIAPAPWQASKQQQIQIAERILARQGPGAWTCNAKVGYPLQSSGPNGSSLEGGAAPYGPATTYRGPHRVQHPVRRVVPHPVPAHRGGSYTVVRGDNLYDITKRSTGNAAGDNWKPLYEANRRTIGANPDLIHPGQVFTLPWKGVPRVHTPVHTRPKVSAPRVSTAEYQLPVHAPIGQVYGNRDSRYTLGFHTGVDFSASYGTVVHAATGGTVIASDTSAAYGLNVQIRNNDGTYTLYAHLSVKSVTPGMHVNAGDHVGNVGSTGASSGAHLHFEVRVRPTFASGNFVDPVDWLRHHGVAL